MSSLKSKIESLLFISNAPFSLKKLADVTKTDQDRVKAAVDELIKDYDGRDRGMNIQRIGDKVQMATEPDNAKLVKDYIKEETTGELSRAALETLTIIAYRGPVSRAELEQIRGVNCAIILRHLLMRGLIDSQDDKKKMQTIYNITFDFLKFLGLSEQSRLPDYDKLNSDTNIQKVLGTEIGEQKSENS